MVKSGLSRSDLGYKPDPPVSGHATQEFVLKGGRGEEPTTKSACGSFHLVARTIAQCLVMAKRAAGWDRVPLKKVLLIARSSGLLLRRNCQLGSRKNSCLRYGK